MPIAPWARPQVNATGALPHRCTFGDHLGAAEENLHARKAASKSARAKRSIRSLILGSAHAPATAPIAPSPANSGRCSAERSSCRCSRTNTALLITVGAAIITTASSTPTKKAITGTAVSGKPRPVTPLINEPNTTARATINSSNPFTVVLSQRQPVPQHRRYFLPTRGWQRHCHRQLFSLFRQEQPA